MSHCLNPACPKPIQSDALNFCPTCGSRLKLGDRYTAYQPIGLGQSSRTFLGLDTTQLLNPRCIIKAFPQEGDGEAFRKQVAKLAGLTHPQLPRILAYFERSPWQFLVQEMVAGESLLQELSQKGAFREAQIWHLLRDVLPVLQFLHQQRIIHRDLKPANLIRRGTVSGQGQLVLVDFGAVKHATESALARTGTVIGSAEYIAPEQLMGKAVFASDLYSLGMTCIHLLTGLSPFELFNPVTGQCLWRSVSGPVSDTLAQILDRLIQRHPTHRYPSVDGVVRDLNEHWSSVKDDLQAEYVWVSLPATVLGGESVSYPPDTEIPKTEWWQESNGWDTHDPIMAIAPFLSFPQIASGGQDGHLRIWDLGSQSLVHDINAHLHAITTVAIAPDDAYLVTGSRDHTVKRWDAAGILRQTFSGHRDAITAIALKPDLNILITASRDQTIRLWSLTTGNLVTTLERHSAAVEVLAVHPKLPFLASGDAQGTVMIWHLGTQEHLRSLLRHSAAVSALALWPPPDRDPLVISAGWDVIIQLRHIHTGATQYTLPGHLLPVGAIALHPSAPVMATASHDNSIKLWSLERGQLLTTLTGHSKVVRSLAFQPDGSLISGSEDGTIKVWQSFS
jgi:WD40 repeat protein